MPTIHMVCFLILLLLRCVLGSEGSRSDLSATFEAVRQSVATVPDEEAIFRWPSPAAEAPFAKEDITYVTQFTVNRLPRVTKLLSSWDGHLSLCVYLTDPDDIDDLAEWWDLNGKTLSSPIRAVRMTIVKPSYSTDPLSIQKRLRYPINRLRNLALQDAPTDYTFVTDVDFVPSPDLYSVMREKGLPLIAQRPLTAVIVPCYILSNVKLDTSYPNSAQELSNFLSSDPPMAALTDPLAGHGPTLPSLLLSPVSSNEICYEPQFEPYYVLHRPSSPGYDERFTDQGGDKQSHSLLLNALGFRFEILRDAWLIHPPKVPNDKLDVWPSDRLRNLSTEHREGVEKSHFSSAQTDKKRFRYFQDFLPEMERMFGGPTALRFPKGCGRGAIMRSFGRPRVGAVFGV